MAEYYPQPLAGQRLTAELLRSMLPQTARKTADTQRSATTTLTDDPHITFDVTAGGVYSFEGWLKYDGPAAGDIHVGWSVPSGTEGEWTGWGAGHNPVISFNSTPAIVSDSQQPRGYTIRTETVEITANRTFGTLGTGLTALTATFSGTLRIGSTGGTFAMKWAQATSDATVTTIYTDSWARLLRIA
jgi:hypothetical protein